MSFDKAFKLVLGAEGGYSNDKADRGGATNFGITQYTYDAWNNKHKMVRSSVKNIKLTEVKEIYETEYWVPAGCQKLSTKLAIVHFDSAVNHGVSKANKLLQRSVGVKEDGKIGPKTIAAINALPEGVVIEDYIAVRIDFYHDIVTNDLSQTRFLKGWLNRVARLEKEVKLA